MKLIKYFLHSRVAAIILFVVTIVLSIVFWNKIKRALYPEYLEPFFTIETRYSSQPAEIVEQRLTEKIESAFKEIRGLKELRSQSENGRSRVYLSFYSDVDIIRTQFDIFDIVDKIIPNLPSDSEKPNVLNFDPNDAADFYLVLKSNSEDKTLSAQRDIFNEKYKQGLKNIGGVAKVELFGVEGLETQVRLKPEFRGEVDLDGIRQFLSRQSVRTRVGHYRAEGKSVPIYIDEFYSNAQSIKSLVYKDKNGKPFTLGEVFQIEETAKKNETLSLLNDSPVLSLAISFERGVDYMRLGKEVHQQIQDYNRQGDFDWQIMTSKYLDIKTELKQLWQSLFFSLISLVLFLVLFFRRFRNTLAILLALPYSLAVVFVYLFISQNSLNSYSLLGIVLLSGAMIDASCLVYESVQQSGKTSETLSRALRILLMSTLSTMLVFVPALFLEEKTAQVFLEIAKALLFGLLGSLVYAVFILPRLFIPKERVPSPSLTKLKIPFYFIFKRRKEALYLLLILTVISLVFTPFYGFSVNKRVQEQYMHFEIFYPTSLKVEVVRKALNRLSLAMKRKGFDLDMHREIKPSRARLTLLVAEEKRQKAIRAFLKSYAFRSQNMDFYFNEDSGGESPKGNIIISFSGKDRQDLYEVLERYSQLAKKSDLVEKQYYLFRRDRKVLVLKRKSERIIHAGDVQKASAFLELYKKGLVTEKYRHFNERRGQIQERDLILRGEVGEKTGLNRLKNTSLYFNKKEQTVNQMYRFNFEESYGRLNRRNGLPELQMQWIGRDGIGQVQLEGLLKNMMREQGGDNNIVIKLVSDELNAAKALKLSVLLLLGSLALIYTMLASVKNSFLYPLKYFLIIFISLFPLLLILSIWDFSFSFSIVAALIVFIGLSFNNLFILDEWAEKVKGIENDLKVFALFFRFIENHFLAIFISTLSTMCALLPGLLSQNENYFEISVILLLGLSLHLLTLPGLVPLVFLRKKNHLNPLLDGKC